MSTNDEGRYTVARQSYNAIADVQGQMTGLEAAADIIHSGDDAEEAAQVAVDLAEDDRGIAFLIFDRDAEGHVAVYADTETREELVAQTRDALANLGEDTPLHDAHIGA